MTDQNDQIPEVAGEIAQDSNVVGTLTVEELQHLTALRQKGAQLAMEIGNLELQKARLVGQVANVETQGQNLLNEVARRLGIPENQLWQVLPDGRARIVMG